MMPVEHIENINKIVARFLEKRDKSRDEMRYQDCERLGMDAVNKYCRDNALPTLGSHMVNAVIRLSE